MPIQATGQPWDELIRAMSLAGTPEQVAQADERSERQAKQIARAAGGCNHARTALLREIEDPCYRFCLAQLACPDRARDATQETALRLLRSLHRYRGEAVFTTWALSIALNICREQRRRRRWFSLPITLSAADPSPGPQAKADHVEQSERLTLALQHLPTRQREAVTLRYLQGLSTVETAQAMRCAEGTVKATLAKALTKLRQSWGRTMPKTTRPPLNRALQEQKQALDEASYPGDLAHDVLQNESEPRRVRWRLTPALATAIIGLGVTLAVVVLQQDRAPQSAAPIAKVQPEPALPDLQESTPPLPQPDARPQPTPRAVAVNPALPEIDRGLLPLRRVGSSTYLASPAPHRHHLDKQSQLAENPNPAKRLRLSASPPNRRAIDRSFSRPLKTKDSPKPERTS